LDIRKGKGICTASTKGRKELENKRSQGTEIARSDIEEWIVVASRDSVPVPGKFNAGIDWPIGRLELRRRLLNLFPGVSLVRPFFATDLIRDQLFVVEV
jgi:hypothetical protein